MVAAKAKALGLDTLAQSVSIGYVIVFLIALGLVLWLNKTTKAKLVGGLVTIGLFALLPYWLFVHKSPAQVQAANEQADFIARYEAAKALFEKLCKEQAGEKIYRTVENVEGILLLKVRPKREDSELTNQMSPSAAVIKEAYADSYIATFLIYERPSRTIKEYLVNQRGLLTTDPSGSPPYPDGWPKRGYRYVDVVDPNTNERNRYTWSAQPQSNLSGIKSKLVMQPTKDLPPRFGVTYEDDMNPEHRKYWIAGTTLKVIDLDKNEVIAQRTLFAFDTGLGNSKGRSPWALAHGCGGYASDQSGQTRMFVDQILKPIQSQNKQGK
jgi:hypothetical protein